MLWSILIAGIPERYHLAQPLLYSLLEKQMVSRMPDVELLYLLDNKRRPVGAKRNDLLAAARGLYVSFIDDDDSVADDYVRRIYRAIVDARKTTPPDIICFRQIAHLETHGITHDCHYSLQYFREREPDKRRGIEMIAGPDGKPVANTFKWTGPPAHTMVWRREVVRDVRFPEQQFGEDVSWVDMACAQASSEIQLGGEPLYIYRQNDAKSATR